MYKRQIEDTATLTRNVLESKINSSTLPTVLTINEEIRASKVTLDGTIFNSDILNRAEEEDLTFENADKMSIVEESGLLSCKKCIYKTNSEGDLNKHMDAKHRQVQYQCEKCEYKLKTSAGLRTHIHSKHSGACYSCERCVYSVTKKSHLKRHIESMHEGVRYSCDHCNYEATRPDRLKKHIKLTHT